MMRDRGVDRLTKYVPKRFRPYVTDAYRDCDGYWMTFSRGVDTCEDPALVLDELHCDTITELRSAVRYLKFCVVDDDYHAVNDAHFDCVEDMLRYRKFYLMWKSAGRESSFRRV